MLLGDTAADVRVLQKVTLSIEAVDEAAAHEATVKRFAEMANLAEDVDFEVTEPVAETEEDEWPDMQQTLQEMGPELAQMARERGWTGGQAEQAWDAHLSSIIEDDPDFDDSPDPLMDVQSNIDTAAPARVPVISRLQADQGRQMQLAALVTQGLDAGEAVNKQWYLWEVARLLGIDHLVRGILSAEGYGPMDFDDVDVMGTPD
jgi:hypothetical protein